MVNKLGETGCKLFKIPYSRFYFGTILVISVFISVFLNFYLQLDVSLLPSNCTRGDARGQPFYKIKDACM